MTITLEQIQELRKGITPGEWQFSESQIESSTDDGFQDVILTTGCLVCEDGYCELDISYDDPNVKAISLVPELLEMAEALITENQALRGHLKDISEIAQYELNPSNYDHEEVCEIGVWCSEMSLIADRALESPGCQQKTEARDE
jgi:hypothetical protein